MYVCMFVQQLALCTHFYPEYHILYTSVCMCVPLWTDLLAVLRDMCISCVCMYVCVCVLAIVHVSVLRANSCIQIAIHETVSPTARLGLAGPLLVVRTYVCKYFLCAVFCMYVCMYVCVFTVCVCMWYVCMYVCIPVVTCSVMYSVCTRILGVYVCILCSVTSVVPHATCATCKHVTTETCQTSYSTKWQHVTHLS